MEHLDKIFLRRAAIEALFPGKLLAMLCSVHNQRAGDLFLTGGTVRDLLLGRKPADIDLTVPCQAIEWARLLTEMSGGTFVLLGRDEDAARVVWQGLDIDFSSFREGALTIVQELHKRDITVNSMAVPIHNLFFGKDRDQEERVAVIDPTHGLDDLKMQRIRVSSRASFPADPLRMLRVFRFAAVLGFAVDEETLVQVHLHSEKIARVSPERIAHELDLIMDSPEAAAACRGLCDSTLLWEVLPELKAGAGMEQPASHHLDVFDHCLEALLQMERVLENPDRFFPENSTVIEQYLVAPRRRRLVKWAALFHDIGKPATYGINEDKGGRITFYNHDLRGADIFTALAGRLRWSNRDTRFVARLIAGHMRPFFLANNQRQDRLTDKACLRLIRAIGEHLPGLFLLAMADALAGKGESSPEQIETEVAGLFTRLQTLEQRQVAPVRNAPPLLTGKDLIALCTLQPGPLFREILEFVEEAHIEQRISTKEEALALVQEYIRKKSEDMP